MSANKQFFFVFAAWGLDVCLGFLAAKSYDSALVGAGVTLLIPTLLLVIFSGPINSAWWSANSAEAQKVGFRTEASASLKFVVVLTLLLGMLGLFASWRGHNFFMAACSGSFLSLSTFSATRLCSISARKSK
jgi:hypothetical protein